MRYAPLTGLLAVVFTVVAFLMMGDTPDTNSSGREVRFFYDDHEAQTAVSLYLLVIAGVLFVFFAACLARALRDAADRNGWLHHVVLAGGVLMAAGFWTGSTVVLALLDSANEPAVGNQTLQTLNTISEDFFIPFVGGMGVLLLAAGLAGIRTAAGVLPRWLSWAGVTLGVLVFIPWVGFFAFMLGGLWVIIASVLLARHPHAAPASAP